MIVPPQGYLERLAELAPNYPSISYALGYVHHNQQHYPEAIQYYERALESDSTDVRAYAELAYTRARERFTTKRMIDQCLELYRSLRKARLEAA